LDLLRLVGRYGLSKKVVIAGTILNIGSYTGGTE
jgi:hypothetical protein